MNSEPELNAQTLESELAWFSAVLNARLQIYLKQGTPIQSIYEIRPPDINLFNSIYAEVVKQNNFSFEERIVLILALVPHIRPELLDVLFAKNAMTDRRFSEFGGLNNYNHQGFLPTRETAAFILSEDGLNSRFKITAYFTSSHSFYKHHILYLDDSRENGPFLSGALRVSNEYISLLTTGTTTKPDYSTPFLATLITTPLNWEDMVLESHLFEDIKDIQTWVNYQRNLLNDYGLKDRVKLGYRALFYGPDGTGKATTACLIGKSMGLDVYQIDLSQIVSNLPGETEKILARFFDIAQNKNWILFFDEADTLFGKRESSTLSNDRYSNQAAAYLLQQIENYSGLVILASNVQANLDEAFARRFQSAIKFHLPNVEERFKIWQKAFSTLEVDESVDLHKVAEEYELSGGSIINILRYSALKTIQKQGDNKKVLLSDIENGIRKELERLGKLV